MEDLSSIRGLIVAVVGHRSLYDTRETWLRRAAGETGISYRAIKELYYGEANGPRLRSLGLLRAAADRATRVEYDRLIQQYSSIAGALERVDSELYGIPIAAFLHAARTLGGPGSTGGSAS